jgi:hypothetical protein
MGDEPALGFDLQGFRGDNRRCMAGAPLVNSLPNVRGGARCANPLSPGGSTQV